MTPEQESKLEELKSAHGKIAYYEEDDIGLVVFKKPDLVLARRFMRDVKDEAKAEVACHDFCNRLVVHPSLKDWSGIVEDMPFLPVSYANGLIKQFGLRAAEAKKL